MTDFLSAKKHLPQNKLFTTIIFSTKKASSSQMKEASEEEVSKRK
jgi:hypothetical protein